jgi:hypothetical protein
MRHALHIEACIMILIVNNYIYLCVMINVNVAVVDGLETHLSAWSVAGLL